MKDELLKILDSFYDLSEGEEEKAIASILKMANEHPGEFTEIIKDIESGDISIIYEALGNDMDNWNDFMAICFKCTLVGPVSLKTSRSEIFIKI